MEEIGSRGFLFFFNHINNNLLPLFSNKNINIVNSFFLYFVNVTKKLFPGKQLMTLRKYL